MALGASRKIVPRSPYQIGQRIALFSMGASAALAAVKITAGWLGHSTSVVADGIESAADMLGSGLILMALQVASRPPDDNHPYGHGRLETLAGLALGIGLTVTGSAICLHSLEAGAGVPAKGWVAWPLAGSIAVKFGMFYWKRRASKQIGSSALQADSWNDAADILSGAVALSAVLLATLGGSAFARADSYGGAAVGVIVVFLGVQVIRDTATQLMDTMPDDPALAEVRTVALSVPGALRIEKCYARKTGLQYHVDLHLEVDPNLTVRQSHEIASQVRICIKEELDWVADVLVHVEPHAS